MIFSACHSLLLILSLLEEHLHVTGDNPEPSTHTFGEIADMHIHAHTEVIKLAFHRKLLLPSQSELPIRASK